MLLALGGRLNDYPAGFSVVSLVMPTRLLVRAAGVAVVSPADFVMCLRTQCGFQLAAFSVILLSVCGHKLGLSMNWVWPNVLSMLFECALTSVFDLFSCQNHVKKNHASCLYMAVLVSFR